jgi:hypothetical protein
VTPRPSVFLSVDAWVGHDGGLSQKRFRGAKARNGIFEQLFTLGRQAKRFQVPTALLSTDLHNVTLMILNAQSKNKTAATVWYQVTYINC